MADKLLRAAVVRERTGLSRTSLWKMEREGRFPARRKVGAQMVGWLESEVDEWLADLPRAVEAPQEHVGA